MSKEAESKVTSYVFYGDFENEDRFLAWVATDRGSNVSETCKARIDEANAAKKNTTAVEVLDALDRATRQVDLSRNEFRAKFGFGQPPANARPLP